jgi:hypothetical protein
MCTFWQLHEFPLGLEIALRLGQRTTLAVSLPSSNRNATLLREANRASLSIGRSFLGVATAGPAILAPLGGSNQTDGPLRYDDIAGRRAKLRKPPSRS